MTASLMRQFGHPSGIGGAVAGMVMSVENRKINKLVVSELSIRPQDAVLEIGCGPGLGLGAAAERATEGLVVGVDDSEVMVAQARRRNRKLIRGGLVRVERAAAENLPFPEQHFTCAFGVNSVQHWSCVRRGLDELYRVLKPFGRFVLAQRAARSTGSLDPHGHGASEDQITAFRTLVGEAGFAGIEERREHLARETVVMVSAYRPPSLFGTEGS